MTNNPESPAQEVEKVSEAKKAVLAVYPKAVLLHNETWGWGVFFNGKPRMDAKGNQTNPDVIVRLKKDAWPSAAFQLMRKVADSRPQEPPAHVDTEVEAAKQKVLEVWPSAYMGIEFIWRKGPTGGVIYVADTWEEAATVLPPASRLPAPALSQPLEAATEQPERCTLCGDTFQEHYPLGSQKVCYNKDPNKMAIITGNVFTAPVEAAQVESGDGLPPLEPARCDTQIDIITEYLRQRERQLRSALSEIERLKGLLRELQVVLVRETGISPSKAAPGSLMQRVAAVIGE